MSQIAVEKKVLNENQKLAAELREKFREHKILVVNIISSPGSGKTTLLERTLERMDKSEARGAADRRSANGKRRHAPGAMGLPGEADHHRRHLPSWTRR